MNNKGGDRVGSIQRLRRTFLLNSSQPADAILISFQHRLIPGVTWSGLVLLALVAARDAFLGLGARVSTFGEMTAVLVALLLLRIRPRWTATIVRTCIMIVTLSNASDCFASSSNLFPEAMIYFPLLVSIAVLLDNLVLGLIVTTVNLGAVTLFSIVRHPMNPLLSSQIFNLVMVTLSFLVGCVAFWILSRRLINRYLDQGLHLDRSVILRKTLLVTLFEKLSSPVTSFMHAANGLGPDRSSDDKIWRDAETAGVEMGNIVARAREASLSASAEDLPPMSGQQEFVLLRGSILRAISMTGIVFGIVFFLKQAVTNGKVMLAFHPIIIAGTLYFLSWRPALVPWLARLTVWILAAAFFCGSWSEISTQQNSLLALYLPMVALFAILLDSLWSALIICLLSLWLVTTWWLGPYQTSGLQIGVMSNVAAVTIFTSVFCFLLSKLFRRLVEQLDERAAGLRKALDLRQRLSSIFSHDISNPLSVIQGIFNLASNGIPLEKDDFKRLRNMGRRISSLLDSARRFHASENSQAVTNLVKVTAQDTFNAAQDLFRERLSEKNLSFRLTGGGNLAFKAQPGLLNDSIMSNFLSNAIKYSNRGSEIEFAAEKLGDRIILSVKDRGIGISAAAMEALTRGERTPSTNGTEGETGFGQGLRLARVYVELMGGELRLEIRPGGGTEAYVLLAAV